MLPHFYLSSHAYYSTCHLVFVSCGVIILHGMSRNGHFKNTPHPNFFARLHLEAQHLLGLGSSRVRTVHVESELFERSPGVVLGNADVYSGVIN